MEDKKESSIVGACDDKSSQEEISSEEGVGNGECNCAANSPCKLSGNCSCRGKKKIKVEINFEK